MHFGDVEGLILISADKFIELLLSDQVDNQRVPLSKFVFVICELCKKGFVANVRCDLVTIPKKLPLSLGPF